MNFFPSVQASVGNAPLGYLPGQQQVNYQSDFGYAQPMGVLPIDIQPMGVMPIDFQPPQPAPSPYNPYPTPTPSPYPNPYPNPGGFGQIGQLVNLMRQAISLLQQLVNRNPYYPPSPPPYNPFPPSVPPYNPNQPIFQPLGVMPIEQPVAPAPTSTTPDDFLANLLRNFINPAV